MNLWTRRYSYPSTVLYMRPPYSSFSLNVLIDIWCSIFSLRIPSGRLGWFSAVEHVRDNLQGCTFCLLMIARSAWVAKESGIVVSPN